jgi:c-di-GMP-binding flagellar brake protein YcgR
MTFLEAAGKRADDQSLSVAEEKEPGAEAEELRIPFRIDDGIVVRAIAGSARVFSSRIVGAMSGQFILITEPSAKISDTVSAVLDGNFLCSYFCEGYLYTFHSRYRNRLMNDIVCIEYPKDAEVRQIRKDRRIKVNIETKVFVCDSGESFLADMTDISRGGCRLVFHHRAAMVKGTDVLLTFSLPNEAVIKKLPASLVRIQNSKDNRTTDAGLSFIGQGGEVSKVADFCEFCTYFEVE